jgi:hypothetical protein
LEKTDYLVEGKVSSMSESGVLVIMNAAFLVEGTYNLEEEKRK